MGDIKGIKGMSNAGIALLISTYGETKLLNQIKTDFLKDSITEKEKRGMFQKLNQLKSKNEILIKSVLINEFDNKIMSMKNNF